MDNPELPNPDAKAQLQAEHDLAMQMAQSQAAMEAHLKQIDAELHQHPQPSAPGELPSPHGLPGAPGNLTAAQSLAQEEHMVQQAMQASHQSVEQAMQAAQQQTQQAMQASQTQDQTLPNHNLAPQGIPNK